MRGVGGRKIANSERFLNTQQSKFSSKQTPDEFKVFLAALTCVAWHDVTAALVPKTAHTLHVASCYAAPMEDA